MSREDNTMNCEDYKTALTTDPSFVDDAKHVDSCAPCQTYTEELLAFNAKLLGAMEISVPELAMPELPEIDADNVVSLRKRRSLFKPTWLAVAATVVLATVFGLRMTGMGTVQGSLEEQVLAHLDHEAYAMRVVSTPVSDSRLKSVVPEDIATMNHDAGLITYAQSCKINGKSVPHLVIQGAKGPIMILLMPDEAISEPKTLDGVGVHGIIVPNGSGSIAIIGDRDEELERVKKNVVNSVTWST